MWKIGMLLVINKQVLEHIIFFQGMVFPILQMHDIDFNGIINSWYSSTIAC